MSDLNVALRLRLENQMKAGAEAAKRDLQALKAEAERLGKTNAALSPAAARAARQTRQIETEKALAVERTTAAYRRQRTEMLAGDLAARRVDRARDVRATREVARMRREARSAQTALAAAGMAGRGYQWMPDARALRSSEAARRARLDAMTTTMAAQRAAEVRAVRDLQLGRNAPAVRPGGAVPVIPGGAGGAAAAGAAGGIAASGRAAGLGYAKSFVGGLGVGLGAAAVGQFVKESLLGAASDEFERDQLRVLGDISEKQMEAFRKGLDRTAQLRGIGTSGSHAVFGGLMAGGLSPKEAAAMADNVAVFAKATQSSLGDASRSTVALRNNMGISTAMEMMAAYDAIAAGGKAGEFEVADMARHLPSLLAKMQNLNESGVTGVRNTVALAQAVRKVVGSSDEAATIFENMLTTFTSSEFISGAKKIGIDVERTMKDAEKNGLSPVFAMLQAIERKTGGDTFKISKLIPNTRAAAAVAAALREAGFMMELLGEMADSAGSTMDDYSKATDNAQEAWGRFSTTIIEKSKSIAEKALPSITAAMDGVTAAMTGGKAEAGSFIAELERLNAGAEKLMKGLRGESEGQTDILTPVLDWLNTHARRFNKGLFGEDGQTDILSPLIFGPNKTAEAYRQYGATRAEAAENARRAAAGEALPRTRGLLPAREAQDSSMKAYNALVNSGDMEAILEEAREERRKAKEARRAANMNPTYQKIEMPGAGEPGRAGGGTPLAPPRGNTFDRMLEGMQNPAGAAAEAMGEYNDALGRGLDDARSKISAAVAEFKAMLSFTAGPTIVPSMVPAAATVAAPGRTGSGSGGGNVNVTQNISTSDPRVAARRAQREQNRAMNLAMANALHDTGLA